jgi:hypothetical protein
VVVKVKVAFSLSEELVSVLKREAPDGNASAFLEVILTKHLDFKNKSSGDAIKFCRKERDKFMTTLDDLTRVAESAKRSLEKMRDCGYKI